MSGARPASAARGRDPGTPLMLAPFMLATLCSSQRSPQTWSPRATRQVEHREPGPASGERGGVEEDQNLSSHLVDGPGELLDRLEREPSVALVGVGLEARHVPPNRLPPNYRDGFVSNSFLLYLFFCGALAFIAVLATFAAAALRALRSRRSEVGLAFGVVAACAIVVASDDYAFFHSSLTFLWTASFAMIHQLPTSARFTASSRALTRTVQPCESSASATTS